MQPWPVLPIVVTLLAPGAPAAWGQPAPRSSIAEAASRAASATTDGKPAPDPMPNGLKWTGIGLVLGGTLTLLSVGIGDAPRGGGSKTPGAVLGLSEFAAGVTLLAIADKRRRPGTPELVVRPGGAALRATVRF